MGDFQLVNYSRFLDKFPKKWSDIFHLAYTPYRYFYLTQVQITHFQKTLQEFHDRRDENYSEKCYSYCYGLYALIRTCLEASCRFNDAFQESNFSEDLKKYRKSKRNDIKPIIDIANDYILHPLDNILDDGKGKSRWYEPGGLNSLGELDLYEWSTAGNESLKVKEIYPLKDMRTVYDYLEGLAKLYSDSMDSCESN